MSLCENFYFKRSKNMRKPVFAAIEVPLAQCYEFFLLKLKEFFIESGTNWQNITRR